MFRCNIKSKYLKIISYYLTNMPLHATLDQKPLFITNKFKFGPIIWSNFQACKKNAHSHVHKFHYIMLSHT